MKAAMKELNLDTPPAQDMAAEYLNSVRFEDLMVSRLLSESLRRAQPQGSFAAELGLAVGRP
jgi:hypothetical protein